MTRIVLRPLQLPAPDRYGRVLLWPPWAWWGRIVHHAADGRLFEHRFNGGDWDGASEIRDVCLLFAPDEDVEIENPPAYRAIEIPRNREYLTARDDRDDGLGSHLRVEVVWHTQPGPDWIWLPGNTCRPRDYEVGYGYNGGTHDSMNHVCDPTLPPLRWPCPVTVPGSREFGARRDETCDTPPQYPARRGYTLADIVTLQAGFAAQGRISPGPPPNPSPRRGPGRGKRILPEAEIIAEIDRLVAEGVPRDDAERYGDIHRIVNEELRPGPVDDYTVNRYPKCRRCGHQWHGLGCSLCECLNTDWLQ